MEENKNEKIVATITEELKKYENNGFKIYFFVMDTKGTPNDSLEYTYNIAFKLKEQGYNVEILHVEKDFVGVGEWMGEKFAELPHSCIEDDYVGISPSDILFIPEIYSSVMYSTRKLTCKRIALLQNFGYLTEMIQPGVKWSDYGIKDCLTITEDLEKRIKDVFPEIRTKVIHPFIDDTLFHTPKVPSKLIINLICKDKRDVNSIVKPFFWKYPMYQWVCFREVDGLPTNETADLYKESSISIWVDDNADFGMEALKAMASGNIVIGKIPDNMPEWMLSGEDIANNGVWFYNNEVAPDIIADSISTVLHNNIPKNFIEEMSKTVGMYTSERQDIELKSILNDYIEEHKKDLTEALYIAKNNLEKEK